MTTTNRTDVFAIAFKLHTLGYSVIPSGGGELHKSPLVPWAPYQNRKPTDDELEKWQQEFQPSLWGVVTGTISGVVVIDADSPEARSAFETELGKPHVITPRGGAHWYFTHPGPPVKNSVGILPGVDIRGDGGFVNVVGKRPDGEYQILRLPTPDNLLDWGKLPGRLIAAMNGSRPASQETKEQIILDGQRNATLASLAGTMRRRGMAQSAVEAALLEVNAAQCQPPLPEKEVLAIARSVSRYAPRSAENPAIKDFNLSDTGNAELFGQLYGHLLRYDHRRRRWLLWSQDRWQPDVDGEVARLGVEAARVRYAQAERILDLKERQRVASWSIASESKMRLEASVSIARNVLPMADRGDSWDLNPWLLGVSNGVVDLKNGELRPGQTGDCITMSTGIDYDAEAKCPRWERFLTEVFDDNELVDWLWRALGYSTSGDTTEQVVFIGHGGGGNGKTKFTEAVRGALGDYSYSSPFSTFELYQRTGIPNDLAALESKRFVTSSETNDSTRLNEARIKAISGGDPITARYLHAEFFTFNPHLKLWLFVNHKPRVVDDSHGFWRRVRLIPFTKQFSGEADDKRLGDKLRAEAPGILAWLVRGCLEWQKRGLNPVPAVVLAATQDYREESDLVASFIGERCFEHPGATVKASAFYKAYKSWAAEQGLQEREILTATAFGRYAGNKFHRNKTREGLFYQGVGLNKEKCEGFVHSSEANIS